MPDFDCREFVAVAEDLLTIPGGAQAHLRTVAGRAYYASYGYIRRRIIEGPGDCFGNLGKHKAVTDACAALTNPHLNRIGSRLLQLKGYRVRADYEWAGASDITDVEAEGAIDTARAVCGKIQTLQANDLQELFNALTR